MKATAKLNNLRISPQKVRSAIDLIKGLDVSDAEVQLENIVRRSNPHMIKLLNSTVSNAENNFGLDRHNLYIYDIQIGEGRTLKRWMPRAYGRATAILKRSSNIVLTVEERVEGKNRKTKEQLEKEKKEKEESKKKMEKEIVEQQKEEGKEEKKEELKPVREAREEAESRNGEKQSGWVKKMFRRKSG